MRHSLRGLCGLKFSYFCIINSFVKSQPARAVWIEIYMPLCVYTMFAVSQPARAVWIEIVLFKFVSSKSGSQPARAVWIEIGIT